ncbi:MAG: PepSY domain-containing protein [Propionibacteriaceae bacterium]
MTTIRPRLQSGVVAALAVILGVALLAGCGGNGPGDTPSKPSASRLPGSAAPSSPAAEPTGGTSQSSAPTPDGTNDGEPSAAVQDLARAGATARDTVDGSTVITIERDDNRWEVELSDSAGDEHDVTVSADGSEVQSGPRKDEQDGDDRDKNLHRVSEAQLDFVAAAEAALAEVPDAEVDDVSLDNHRNSSGPTVWDVTLRGGDGQEHELAVDAGDGSILEHQTDD